MLSTAEIEPDPTAASVALINLGMRPSLLAKEMKISVSSASLVLRHLQKPRIETRRRISKRYKIPVTDWLRAPDGTPTREHAPPPPEPQAGETPDDLVNAVRERRNTGAGLTDTETLAANRVELRALTDRVNEALGALTERERVICHSGFRVMRKTLLDLLEVEPELQRAVELALPHPPPLGAVAQLRQCRRELDELHATVTRIGVAKLAIGAGITRAAQFDHQAGQIARLIKTATLDGSNLKELFKSETWVLCVKATCNALRHDREALDCCKEALEPLNEPFARAMLAELKIVSEITWPCVRFQKDLLGFFYFILGCDPWDRQRELLQNVQDYDWGACASGHRVSKSYSLAGIALWFYSSFPNARVFITAPGERQLQEVVWRELRMRVAQSGICVDCKKKNEVLALGERIAAPCPHSAKIEGYIKETAKGGMHSEDFRQITGFTAKDAESTAGLAGENIMILVEEASGVGDYVFVATKGNLAGGGKLWLFGNPTRNEGEFFDAFFSKQRKENDDGTISGDYKTMRISSRESPNVLDGRVVIPGLATLEWCDKRLEEWGADSPLYKVRVLGEHSLGEEGRPFSVKAITDSEERWYEVVDEGPLYIGIDPAGPSGTNDKSSFAPRRGLKIYEVRVPDRGLDEDGHLAEALGMIAKYGTPGEPVHVNIDSEGLGAGIVSRFQQYAQNNPLIKVHAIRASSNAQRETNVYDRWRDELCGNLVKWMRAGGGIPIDLKLQAELHALDLKMKLTPKGERVKLTPKDVLIKILHRSPDRYDSVALACWDAAQDENLPETVKQNETVTGRGQALDPYADNAMAIDPYG